MTTKKPPYLSIIKQVFLSIFTLGIWTYVWQNRTIGFANQVTSKKKDAETLSLLSIVFPQALIPWVLSLMSVLRLKPYKNEENKQKKFPMIFAVIFTAMVVILSVVIMVIDIILVALLIFYLICKVAAIDPDPNNAGKLILFFHETLLPLMGAGAKDFLVFHSTQFTLFGYLAIGLVALRTELTPMVLFVILLFSQIKINKIADEKGISPKVAYSSGAVESPYMSIGAYIVLSILTLGLWTALSHIGKITGFLNRVSENKRHKLDETLLCLLVPGYYFYWAVKSAEQIDAFSESLGVGTRIKIPVKIMACLGVISLGSVYHPINIIMQNVLNNNVYMRKVDSEGILEIRNLRKCFPIGKTLFGTVTRELNAVKNASFVLKAGETLGIVGESGCGKTTMGRTILKLYPSEEGQIIFNGYDITYCPKEQTRKMRKDMQIIFQDPYSSLPPRSTVGGILTEPVHVHNIVSKSQEKEYVLNLMERCGLRDYYYERYPHEFSGGQRQRICIARALSVNPKLVICDEPVSALDVSIQAQIINLLKDLQKNMGLTYLFISHDLSVVKYISDKIGVMYLGTMMEFGGKEDIFANPLHPYTKALFSAIPNPNPDVKMNRMVLKGDIPSPANPPKGCAFHTRCPYAMDICKEVPPAYVEHEPGHFAACHLLTQNDNQSNEER